MLHGTLRAKAQGSLPAEQIPKVFSQFLANFCGLRPTLGYTPKVSSICSTFGKVSQNGGISSSYLVWYVLMRWYAIAVD